MFFPPFNSTHKLIYLYYSPFFQTPEVYRETPQVPVAASIDSVFNPGSAMTQTGSSVHTDSSSHTGMHSHGGSLSLASAQPGTQTVQKTEVVETVVETSKQDAAATATNEVASAASASQTNALSGPVGLVAETAAAASAASAASSSSATEEKSVKKTKKTTTVVHTSGGHPASSLTGAGGVQETTKIVEEVSHTGSSSSSAAQATAAEATASESLAATSGVLGTSSAEAASSSATSAASSSAAASESNTTSVKTKTIKTTVVQKQNAATAPMDVVDSGLIVGTEHSPPKMVLSSTNDQPKSIDIKAALLATEAPKVAAPVVKRETTTIAPKVNIYFFLFTHICHTSKRKRFLDNLIYQYQPNKNVLMKINY